MFARDRMVRESAKKERESGRQVNRFRCRKTSRMLCSAAILEQITGCRDDDSVDDLSSTPPGLTGHSWLETVFEREREGDWGGVVKSSTSETLLTVPSRCRKLACDGFLGLESAKPRLRFIITIMFRLVQWSKETNRKLHIFQSTCQICELPVTSHL